METIDTLLIAADFFGYPQEIITALAARGRAGMWFDDRPATDTMTKALIRLSPSIIEARSRQYFDSITEQARGHDIRDVLVIKGEALSRESIIRMRKALPHARFTLYFWDSFKNMPQGSADKIDLFDRAFSFDLDDVEADPRLQYRPLFYIESYASVGGVKQDIDLIFIGTAHSDRVAVLERLASAVPPGYHFKKILFARSAALHAIQRVVSAPYRRTAAKDFIFKPLSKQEVAGLIARSKIVVDIERSIQTGFTMRTIEMLGSAKKLITTNPSIVKAEFYTPSNQAYVDRRAPVIDEAFLTRPWLPQSEALLRRYSLSGWLDDVLG